MNKENEENKHVNVLPQCPQEQATIEAGQWETNNKKVIDAYGC
jgi:hypothetical protein